MDNETLSGLEACVEALSRPGVLGLPGRTVEKRVAKGLKGYFDRLSSAVDPKRLGKLVDTASTATSGRFAAEHLASIAVRKMRPQLRAVLTAGLEDAFETARTHVHVAEASQPFDKADTPLITDAVEWAEEHAAELIKGLDQTTIDAIAQEVADGIAEQLGSAGTAREIRDMMDGWSVSRAATIASTEINRAISFATVEKLEGDGYEYKRVILSPDACDEVCVPNADQGAIPLDDDFDSGDAYPPFHPNCRCAVTAARGPDSEA